MSVRRLTALLPLLALLLLGSALTTPAGAVAVPLAVPDPVATVTVDSVTQGHNQGTTQVWTVAASWTASATATGYTVKITNLAGTADYGTTKDVNGTSTTFTTGSLASGNDYLVSVTPKNLDGDGTATTQQFTAIVLDVDAPTGTYAVAPTHAWLEFDFASFEETETAAVTITQKVAPTDASGPITRRVLAGDGSPAKAWASGSTIQVTYTKAGTYTPQVELTDGFGNSQLISLSAVTIADDNTRPVVAVTRPDSSVRNRISAWRVVRGTATDVGTGVDAVFAMVMQKRGGVWYAYHFGKRRWIKGKPGKGEAYNLGHIKARPALVTPNAAGQWRTPRIRGLKTGLISVHSAAFDAVLNLSFGKVVRQRITRS